jgi:hypothetical protein
MVEKVDTLLKEYEQEKPILSETKKLFCSISSIDEKVNNLFGVTHCGQTSYIKRNREKYIKKQDICFKI